MSQSRAAALDALRNPLAIAEVAARLGVVHKSAQGMVERLRDAGLVKPCGVKQYEIQDPKKRQVVATGNAFVLTEKGRQVWLGSLK